MEGAKKKEGPRMSDRFVDRISRPRLVLWHDLSDYFRNELDYDYYEQRKSMQGKLWVQPAVRVNP